MEGSSWSFEYYERNPVEKVKRSTNDKEHSRRRISNMESKFLSKPLIELFTMLGLKSEGRRKAVEHEKQRVVS